MCGAVGVGRHGAMSAHKFQRQVPVRHSQGDAGRDTWGDHIGFGFVMFCCGGEGAGRSWP